MLLYRVQRILAYVGMVAILIAGFAKGIDLPAFIASLRGWSTIPAWATVPLGVTVMTVELVCAGAWLFKLRRHVAARMALGLILFFTGALILESWIAEPPDCHCFGEWLRFELRQDKLQVLLIRNLLLIISLLAECVYGKKV